MRAAIGFFVLFLLVSACGGNVVVDQSSGGSTTTTSVSSSGTTTATTSSSTSAPPDCMTVGGGGVGLACSPEGTTCHMDYACCQGLITCQAGVWTAEPPTCNSACLPCGEGLDCATDAICVHDTAIHDFYQCMMNPCQGMPDCMCAATACAQNFQQCQSTQMYTVTCGN